MGAALSSYRFGPSAARPPATHAPPPPRNVNPPANLEGGNPAPAPAPAVQPSVEADWRAAMTAALAALTAQVETGRAAAEAQAEAGRAAAVTQAEALRAQTAQTMALGATMRAQAEAAATRHSYTTTRLDLIRATIDASQFALGVAHGERLRLAKRPRLSDAEEVLAIPYLSQRSVMSYLRQDEVLELRAASRTCREAVAEHAWSDFDEADPYVESCIRGRLSSWRECFPLARAANLSDNKKLTDADFVHLRGVRKVNMQGCSQATITDAAFAHLRGIHTLNMSGCNQAAITDAAFAHLQGIHSLDMSYCNQATITDVAFAHLAGIHTLDMINCGQASITDAAFAHLRGIHTLLLKCTQITDAAILHLVGLRVLFIGCPQISDAALAQLMGHGACISRVG